MPAGLLGRLGDGRSVSQLGVVSEVLPEGRGIWKLKWGGGGGGGAAGFGLALKGAAGDAKCLILPGTCPPKRSFSCPK